MPLTSSARSWLINVVNRRFVEWDEFLQIPLLNGSSDDMTVDGSSEAVAFSATVPAKSVYCIRSITARIVDDGITPLKFGGLSALSNGLTAALYDGEGTLLYDFLHGSTIKTNADLSQLSSHTIFRDDDVSPVADFIDFTWDIGEGVDGFLVLGPNVEFRVTVQDNLTALTAFNMGIAGRQYINIPDAVS